MLKKKEKLSKKLNKNVLKLKKSLKKEKLSKKYKKRFLDFKRALFQKSAQDWYKVLAISERKKKFRAKMFQLYNVYFCVGLFVGAVRIDTF